ncbi:phage holin family protein [Bacillus swezeyi]|uniref:Holin n=1 Tax=Bacillus swezeyi TaxID=1925020 RepID=A0A1R1QA73_9BACI|nr:phage holin family protein [Bacillus swezeyi]MEC1261993.1 phage holin family protein [Bacillus swezeyi]MED1741446.1 phage holin family protein [Bacillus swezeyi]MED2930553.1 phage holin family protein [Bacillus swezeyi]MED2944535.1 phage holin family protein [Bacillus swezeyi]MED2963884.1 phage holin family protein [Bacillus swezeyi]
MIRDLGIFSLAAGLSAIGFLFGTIEYLFMILITLMGIEFVSKSLNECVNDQFAINRLFTRLAKKLVTLSLISVAHFFDQLLQTDNSIRDFAIMFYILYEAFQIVSTAHSLGIPVPQVFLDILEIIKEKLRGRP